MSNRLIKKIEAEQRRVDQDAFLAGVTALGFPPERKKKLCENYRWLAAVQFIQEETDTPRIRKIYQIAREAYLLSLDQAIQSLPRSLKLADWNRAGEAMNRVYRQVYDRSRD